MVVQVKINDLNVRSTGPTRITDNTSTTFELMITDCPESIRKAKTISANAISDLEVIYLLADIQVWSQSLRSVRNFRDVDVQQLQAGFQAKDFQRFYKSDDVEDKQRC